MPNFTIEYVYQISDFSTTGGNIAPPNEAGAQAQGSPPFNITLNTGATAQQIDLEDSDSGLDEINNAGQFLTSAITLDGVTYPVGTTILVNYRITDNNGFNGYSITLGASNTGGNTTTAFITDGPMVPGQQYVFTSESNIGQGDIPYTELACFTAGSLIEMATGHKDVADVTPGDIVMTPDGPRSVRWVGTRTVPAIGDFAPIRFEAGTLGDHNTIEVSPNHRMLISGALAELYLGHDEVLLAAKHLVNGTTVRRMPRGFVTYVHVMFDDHTIVSVNGCLSESFYPGADAEHLLDADQAAEVYALFPDLECGGAPALVHPEAKAFEADLIAYALAA